MAARKDDLYDEDFYAWTQDQAAALRRLAAERWNGPLDLERLAEEVEDLGSERRDAVLSLLERLCSTCSSSNTRPSDRPRRGWLITMRNARCCPAPPPRPVRCATPSSSSSPTATTPRGTMRPWSWPSTTSVMRPATCRGLPLHARPAPRPRLAPHQPPRPDRRASMSTALPPRPGPRTATAARAPAHTGPSQAGSAPQVAASSAWAAPSTSTNRREPIRRRRDRAATAGRGPRSGP